jgi:hypothetical protein
MRPEVTRLMLKEAEGKEQPRGQAPSTVALWDRPALKA